jgi:hypothetical protein
MYPTPGIVFLMVAWLNIIISVKPKMQEKRETLITEFEHS